MTRTESLAAAFDEHRAHLHLVAQRLLGASGDAEDAVQESWLRLARSEAGEIADLRGWLTTVVGRVCLDMLRTRTSRREDPLAVWVPDPVVTPADGSPSRPLDPEARLHRADSVGIALLVILETLDPAERLAFVLHDLFGVSFDEVAQVVERSPEAARKLASRARQRLRSDAPQVDPDPREQRRVADAFLDAARAGDFDALLALLDPDIVLRADGGAMASATKVVRGAAAVLEQADRFSRGLTTQVVQVNGHIGFLARRGDGRPFSVVALSVAGGRIVQMDILADPHRIAQLDLSGIK
jgi:RNA polymerase sigma factor (sigma-70 family)